MIRETIEIDINAFSSAIDETIRAEKFATDKTKLSSNNNDMLTLACMTSAIYQDLVGYLDDDNKRKLKNFKAGQKE